MSPRPAVEVGSHLEVLALIEEPEEDSNVSKEYSQWVAVVVVAAADGTAAHKKPTATGQMRKVNAVQGRRRGGMAWAPGRHLQQQRPRLLAR